MNGGRGRRGDVFVTGVGIVSPLGVGRESFWSRLCAGESGVVAGAAPDGVSAAARLGEFAARDFIRSPHFRRMDAPSRMIVAASRLALMDAGVAEDSVAPERLAVVVGSAFGDINDTLEYIRRLFTKGPTLVSPMMFPSLVLNAPASYTAMELGCTGANFTVAQGEISGEQAISMGCDLIRSGRADVVLAGGGDELGKIVWQTYAELRALASQRGGRDWCSPYDVQRSGLVLGEGAGMLVLESPERARQRGATAYAAVEDDICFGVTSPLYDWPTRGEDVATALRPFCFAPTSTDEPPVDVVFGSANSSRNLDQLEVHALMRLFGEAASMIGVTSIKGAVGEFGGAGALTAAAAVLSLRNGHIPPLCNLEEPIVGGLRFVTTATRQTRPGRALQLGVARGGAVSATLFRGLSE